uniref:Acid phosphatase n=1 Tax=Caenorhabditis japonica TaxID=281687 RepID=A0A8R1INF4_CAEJA
MRTFSLCIVLLLIQIQTVRSDKLLFAQVLFRHGARAPSESLTNDSLTSKFPRGLGELTDRGFHNSHLLGKFLRKRYVTSGFLNENLIPSEMYWRSVSKTRCLSTAATVGAAMFAHPKLPLQVPVFTEEHNENLLNYDQANCPKETELVKKSCPKFTGNYNPWPKYEEFIAGCLNFSHPVFKEYPFHTLESYINQYKNEIPLPKPLADNWKDLSRMYAHTYQKITGTGMHLNEGLMRLKFGHLMHTLQTNIQTRPVKFIAYSTQDWMLMGVLTGYGVFKEALGLDTYPEYNSMIMIEVYENQKNELYVKVFYKAEEKTEEDHPKLIDLTSKIISCRPYPKCAFGDFLDCCTKFETDTPAKECGAVPKTLRRKRRFAGPK